MCPKVAQTSENCPECSLNSISKIMRDLLLHGEGVVN